MAANSATASKRTTMAFRDDMIQRKRLEAIQVAKGHRELSDTLREAVSEYVTAHRDLLASEDRGR